jgi:hypothetical protein
MCNSEPSRRAISIRSDGPPRTPVQLSNDWTLDAYYWLSERAKPAGWRMNEEKRKEYVVYGTILVSAIGALLPALLAHDCFRQVISFVACVE